MTGMALATRHPLTHSAYIDLGDPRTARHYLQAMHVMHGLPAFDWYDSHFLARFEAARRFLRLARPEALDRFTQAFSPLTTRPDFRVRHLHDVLAPEAFDALIREVGAIPPRSLKSYESAAFGRRILHDLPALDTLQAELTPLVSALAGEPVEPCYNFLSLYHGAGRCPPHLDAPSAKWTLDLCLAQNRPWPIHFTDVVAWPTADDAAKLPISPAPRDIAAPFRSHILQPNEALLFSGSAQWHYRDAIPQGGYCHLAFLHYHPAGCADLVEPSRWAEHFALPELGVMDAVFNAQRPVTRT